MSLALSAEELLERCQDEPVAEAEVASLRGLVSFFTGAYARAVATAEDSIRLSDTTEDLDLRIYVRRAALLVHGNLSVNDLERRLEELHQLSFASDNVWEQAVTLNDIAAQRESVGDPVGARTAIEQALELAQGISPNRFALAVILSTRADISLRDGNPAAALRDAERSLALLSESEHPNPYVLGASVRAQVAAKMALHEYDDARATAERALAQIGDRLPRTRSMILATVAEALREAGWLAEAYDTLARSAALEREALAGIAELQFSLERATLEARLARSENEALALKNLELAAAHAELESRTRQLEDLERQLRDQAERDWLTGVHNRRFLARALEGHEDGHVDQLLSVAVLDLDHFKLINDRYGHSVGDRVLVRAAELLCSVLRVSDTVIRSGGEEFLVLMPEAEDEAARLCCERMRDVIRGECWDTIAPGLELTISIGVATADSPEDLSSLLRLADDRLYKAKNAGRDCVIAR